MARGVYVVQGQNITVVNAACTLAWINAHATMALEIMRAWVAQDASAVSAQQRVQLSTQVTAFPTLTSKTPQPLVLGTAASAIAGATTGAAGTSGINASAEGAGAKTVLWPDAFNVLNGWLWLPSREERIILPAGAAYGLGLVFPVAPAGLTGWSFGMVFKELA
jgi:hypothetical protein